MTTGTSREHKRQSVCVRLIPVAAIAVAGMSAFVRETAGKEDAASVPPKTASFYVAPKGSDAAAGSSKAPFATLTRARDAVRALKAKDGLPAGGVTVWLRGGIYPVTETFALSGEDSGAEGRPIVYAAMPGERPVFFGGTDLEHAWFQPVTNRAVLDRIISPQARTNVLECDLKAHGITDYGELSLRGFVRGRSKPAPVTLYVGGKRMMLARWPNPDQHFPEMLWRGDSARKGVVARSGIVDPGPKKDDADFMNRGGTFRYDFDRPALWSKADDVWLDGIFAWSWEWSYNKVARIDPEKKEITLRYGEVSGITDQYSGNFFFAENLLEEIDLPGEYYLDRGAGMLYLLPNDDFRRGAPVCVSTLSVKMFSIEKASDINLNGITFDMSRAAAFEVKDCKRVRVERCEIRNFAGGGGGFTGTDCAFYACEFRNLGASGVWIGGGDLKTLRPSHNSVENCSFHDFGWYQRVYTPAIGVSGVGVHVAHNLFYDAPHCAMLVKGNDHLIEYNEFRDVCLEFIDLGAIYINCGSAPLERGWVIRRNYFHDIAATREAPINIACIYFDHGTQDGLVEENVFNRVGDDSRGWATAAIKNVGGLYTIARNNAFVDCTVAWKGGMLPPPAEYRAKRYGDQYKFGEYFAKFDLANLPHLEKYPEVRAFLPDAPPLTEEQMWSRFESNLVWNPNVARLTSNGISMENKEPEKTPVGPLRVKDNWVADSDPGFVNAAAGDFNLRPDAPVFTNIPGFVAIPFSEIGLRGPVGPGSETPSKREGVSSAEKSR